MIRVLLGFFFCFWSLNFIQAQTNSAPYINKSLIKLHYSNQEIVDSLLQLGVIPISCRGSVLESNLIVDSTTISWLNQNNILYSTLETL